MVTYKTQKNKKQSKYLTADTKQGKVVLKYLHKYCEKALAYCQQQGLTTLEDFAEALEQISSEDNPKLKIAVEVNKGGLSMKLANQPELGYTTGKYMMQHLDFDENKQGKFTRAGIETALDPDRKQSSSKNKSKISENELLEMLGKSIELNESEDNLEQDDFEQDEIDDALALVDETPTRSSTKQSHKPSNRSKSAQETPPKRRSLNYDDLLDRNSFLDKTADFSAAAATEGHELNGLNLAGLSAQLAILAAVVGQKSAKQIMAAAKKNGQEKEVAKIAQRLKAAQERTDELTERSEQLTEVLFKEQAELKTFETEDEDEEESLAIETETKNQTEKEPPKSSGEILAAAVSKLDEQITRTGLTKEKSKPFTIDKNASLPQQFKQLDKALDRIEKRLDNLEKRIETLEKAVESLKKTSQKSEVGTPEQGLRNREQTTINNPKSSTLYFDGGSRKNPGIAAAAAVIVTPDGVSHTVSQALGQATNNQAEYAGLILGLQKAQALGIQELELKGDSQLIINQIEGSNKVKSPVLQPLNQEALNLLEQFEDVDLTWIPRSENTLADLAVNDCLDETIQNPAEIALTPSKSFIQNPDSEAVDCAKILAKICDLSEERTGSTLEDGIPFGKQATLYKEDDLDATTIRIETHDNSELFCATLIDNDWTIDHDSLSDQEKKQIKSLSEPELTKPVEQKPKKSHSKAQIEA